jgi:hypothetical protein
MPDARRSLNSRMGECQAHVDRETVPLEEDMTKTDPLEEQLNNHHAAADHSERVSESLAH